MRLVANVWVLSGFDPKNNQTHGLVNSMSHHVPPTLLGDFEHPLQMDVGSRRQALENHEPQRLKHPDKSFEGGKHKCLKLDEANRHCREINILETTQNHHHGVVSPSTFQQQSTCLTDGNSVALALMRRTSGENLVESGRLLSLRNIQVMSRDNWVCL